MRRLWQDIRAHQRTVLLLLGYWLATLAVVLITWIGGIPVPVVVLLFTTPLIAGALVGRWRTSTQTRSLDQIWGGALVGLLSAEMTLLVMKGGVIGQLIGSLQGERFRGGEVLGFGIATAVLGTCLGLAGAWLAVTLEPVHRQV